MAVRVINFPIEQGTDFSLSLTLKSNGAPIDLSDYDFSAKLRKHYGASNYYEFSIDKLDPMTNGKLIIGMASTVTSTITPGRYVYDVIATSGIGTTAVTSKYFKGNVIVEGTSS
jgi:predicted secreted hydrolase